MHAVEVETVLFQWMRNYHWSPIVLQTFSLVLTIAMMAYCAVLSIRVIAEAQLIESEPLILKIIAGTCLVLQSAISAIASRTGELRISWIVWVMHCGILSFLLCERPTENLWLVALSGLLVLIWTARIGLKLGDDSQQP